ncbi:MAG: hypothetical protein HYX93_05315 [Chloroflexi bacterium]|nr:hypothetical protein [Chloroflexota bacterium]
MTNPLEPTTGQNTESESTTHPFEPVLGQASELESTFNDTLDSVVEIVGSRPTVSIYLVDEENGELVLGHATGGSGNR